MIDEALEHLVKGRGEGGILILDDYTRSEPRFMQATMELIDRQEYISWKLPKNWHIVLTTNPDNGDYNVTSLDIAQKTRFISVEVKFDEKSKPGISNLLTIHSALSGKSIAELENEFSGKGYGDFKSAVAEVVISSLEPIAKRTNELMSDRSELIKILKSGAVKANQVASETLKAAYSAIGLIS